ncbi:MAG: dienelactone hydrolase family protein [Bacteroidota bacterium]
MPPSDPHADQPVLASGTPLGDAHAAVVLLHGRGASAQNILMLASEFGRGDLAYLAPQAAGSSWYPYSFLAPLSQNEPKLSSALQVVGRMLDELEAGGVPPEHVVLAGFSQGACLASEYVARNTRRYGGVAVLSGGLIGREQLRGADPPADKRLDYEGDLAGTPVFLGCSDVDPHIPLVRVEDSADALGRLGAEVTLQVYPGMGHTVNDDKIEYVRRLLNRLHPTVH